jgi:hypothetical protein
MNPIIYIFRYSNYYLCLFDAILAFLSQLVIHLLYPPILLFNCYIFNLFYYKPQHPILNFNNIGPLNQEDLNTPTSSSTL